jgi:hypothetical protein
MAVGLPLKTTYANGDVYSASDVNDTNGTVNLFTSSTLSVAGGKNAIVNGGFDIWQRGTSFVGQNLAAGYSADRWVAYRPVAGSTFTRQLTNDTTNLPNIQYCLRVARDSGNTATNLILTVSNQESLTARPFAGKTVTVSWYARAGANYSAASSLLNYEFATGTGTDQNILASYTGQVLTTGTRTLTTTWQRFSYTVTLAANATEFAIDFYFTPVGTAGAADYFEITGVQVELGSVATTFSRAGGTIQGELANCQRYFYQFVSGSNKDIGMGAYYNSTQAHTFIQFPVTMRTTPVLVIATGTDFYAFSRNNSTDNFNSFTLYQASTNGAGMYNNSEVSGTSGVAGPMSTFSGSASIAFNSEL